MRAYIIRLPIFIALIIIAAVFINSCTPAVSIKEETVDTGIDISHIWNDTDSKLVTRQCINDMVHRGWLTGFIQRNTRNPVIKLTDIKNLSSEPINLTHFKNDIAEEIKRHEKVDLGEEKADYILTVEIKVTNEIYRQNRYKAFWIEFNLVNTSTDEKDWTAVKEIRKFIDEDKPLL